MMMMMMHWLVYAMVSFIAVLAAREMCNYFNFILIKQ
jgi:hypothetical protein